ncbi:MAG: Nif3-like dinuclear metal center hexameric protein [Candidatus Pacebacteria bacterium]|nr:Nif3-like dinuclear metal center hexameric protein [Candidatus Paceibacterota bacterium]
MSVKRNKIIEHLNEYLRVQDFEDGCVNGLQIEGNENVSKIVTGVSLSERLISEAIKKKAEMLIVHHGFFANVISSPLQLNGFVKNRIKMILENDINLAGYHLPLDAHPLIGNNISLAKLFGAKKCKSFDIGFVGELDEEMDFSKFVSLVEKKLGAKSFFLPYGKKKIKKVAVISGGASPDYIQAIEIGADVFVTGDIRENVVREVEESGINVINAGHYNTEKIGIMNLGKLVEKKFNVGVEFVDVPCEF